MEEAVAIVQETAAVVVNYGIWCLIPIVVIFVLSVVTKRTLFAMFSGVLTGVIIKTIGQSSNFMATFLGTFYRSMGDEAFQWVTLIVIGIGMMIVLFERSDSVKDLGLWMSKYLKTQKQVLFGTFIFGIIVFIDDYLSNLAVGNTMKRLTDKYKIPRTQLGYVTLLMAGPISLLIPLSSWTVAYAGVYETVGIVGADGSGFQPFLQSIPFMFYAWVVIVVLLLQILGIIPKVGMIKKDYERAEKTGNLFPEGVEPVKDEEALDGKAINYKPKPWNFLIPIIVTIIITFLTNKDVSTGIFSGVLAAFLIYVIGGRLTFKQALTACFDGVLRMGFVAVLFVLAFSVQGLNNDLGVPAFVIGAVEPFMTGAFLPVTAFVICSVYSYFTGTCWDLVMIVLPIVAPLSLIVGIDPLLVSAAVFSGSLFGNVLCPYGDGVILSAQACDIRPMDIMIAILPYMVFSGIITAVMYLIAGFIF
ncbi:MAG: hypothetical protein LBV66_02985 [Elusimicrobiota bacterium]|nr:hypothetical protein [Elusimicrobiota bacterium]